MDAAPSATGRPGSPGFRPNFGPPGGGPRRKIVIVIAALSGTIAAIMIVACYSLVRKWARRKRAREAVFTDSVVQVEAARGNTTNAEGPAGNGEDEAEKDQDDDEEAGVWLRPQSVASTSLATVGDQIPPQTSHIWAADRPIKSPPMSHAPLRRGTLRGMSLPGRPAETETYWIHGSDTPRNESPLPPPYEES